MSEGLTPGDGTLALLAEIGNVGAGHAATALSVLVQDRVSISVTETCVCSFREIPAIAGGDEVLTAAVLLRLEGDVTGDMMFLLPVPSARRLVQRMFGRAAEASEADFSEMELSALAEAGNILGGSYVTAVSTLTGLRLIQSVPAVAVDMAGAILGTVLTDTGQTSDYAVVIRTSIHQGGADVDGHLFLLPDPPCVPTLFTALGWTYG
ncbi:MAG: chemotaxis protein CheC [Alicyclobacillus macrosporangiidus]|uniref:chemotaxis protein CheC n=1 Tax=Alicyclobacillus macrosporangiidus TaxID=392015 RepID=UPI0026F335E1|nr:chemotaxis protein CheC [Alicyclobacillus macrosporangiidus]MCL6597345.1 chemotaxis protein CheC [Alicyclobacillus macrosporangiidus]